MAEQQRVILYGDTLILAGVQASLSASPNLEIIALSESPADLAEAIHELHPSAVIFDLGSDLPDFPLADLQQSNLLLIGIDPDSDKLLVQSSHQERAVAVADLLRLICRGEMGGKGDAETQRHGDGRSR